MSGETDKNDPEKLKIQFVTTKCQKQARITEGRQSGRRKGKEETNMTGNNFKKIKKLYRKYSRIAGTTSCPVAALTNAFLGTFLCSLTCLGTCEGKCSW
jgi:hypothetical protein